MIWILRLFYALLGMKTKTGFLCISTGHHEININTKWMPSKILIDFGEMSPPTCANTQDNFDVKVTKNGFLITADINSNNRQIEWIAIK